MRLYPTRSTFHVAVAGIGLITIGAAARLSPVVAFGGAMLLAVAFGRALARVGIARLRAAGFEMVWSKTTRVHRISRGTTLVVRGELRNRGEDPARATRLRPIASSMLDATIEPSVVDLPPGACAIVDVTVRGRRVGRWGLHGLALEVSGSPFGTEGLYEVPLIFGNPLGIEVLPASLSAFVASPIGGRSRRVAASGRSGRIAGQGDELRELRDHVAGDPFKRIAWKASARRGRLLVRETDREERDVVWFVLDASVELWAGAPEVAPLDRSVDEVAAAATKHLRQGDRVGLIVTASRLRSWIEPEGGAAHGLTLASALASCASVVDADRSELEEVDVARLVAEHLRPLDPTGLSDVPKRDLDALAARAEQIRSSAPFAPRLPFAPTAREQTLRHYLASFGIESPPRVDGERERAEATLARVLERLSNEKTRGSVVHVWAPPPTRPLSVAKPIAAIRRRGVEVRWTLPVYDPGLASGERHSAVRAVVEQAVRSRAQATRQKGERALRRLGVRLVTPRASATLVLANFGAPSEPAGGPRP